MTLVKKSDNNKLNDSENNYNSFRLKKRHLISIEKIHSIKNIFMRKKKTVHFN